MNLLHTFSLLATCLSVGKARLHDRELGVNSFYPGTDGNCTWGPVDEMPIGPFLLSAKYNPDCNCGVFNDYLPGEDGYISPEEAGVCPEDLGAFYGCFPRSCEFVGGSEGAYDVALAVLGKRYVPSVELYFNNLATWIVGHKQDTLHCIPPKGRHNKEVEIGDGIAKETTSGHGFLFYNDPSREDQLAEGIKNIKLPGIYWMDGGVVVSEDTDCKEWPSGGRTCSSLTTKTQGRFYDMCYELAKGVTGLQAITHCDGLLKSDCTKINTCQWNKADGMCIYSV